MTKDNMIARLFGSKADPDLVPVRGALPKEPSSLPAISLRVERLRLLKRRWRARALDGTEFGFDLFEPLQHGDVFYRSSAAVYLMEQDPEKLLRIRLHPNSLNITPTELAWNIGNLHLPIQLTADEMRVLDDPLMRHLLASLRIAFEETCGVFQPLKSAANSVGHGHSH